MSYIAINYKKDAYYPDLNDNPTFRPSIPYPEYPFGNELSKEENLVYDMVRETLHLLMLDKENYGTSLWNPLGKFIKPSDYVVLKPNLVMHKNFRAGGENDLECVYTNAAVIASLIDYVVIALKGTGTIVVGDAPVQECDFVELVNISGYQKLIDYYKDKGINICLKDFRGLVTKIDNGIFHQTENTQAKGVIVNLDRESEFCSLSKKQLSRIRITNYKPSELLRHHNESHHEYCIAEDVLKADCIISVPKPKTHMRAGVTAALKNLVGINCRKEYLPHHTLGAKKNGGDEHNGISLLKVVRHWLHDRYCDNIADKRYLLAKVYSRLFGILDKIMRMFFFDKTNFGSWSGNNTISKTTIDLNKIIRFADKDGIIKHTAQRKIFSVGDMVVSGEGNGPLTPSPKYVGMIVAGENSVCFDEVVATIMGGGIEKIPTLKNARKCIGSLQIIEKNDKAYIFSNYAGYNNKKIDEIQEKDVLHFSPPYGWENCFKV